MTFLFVISFVIISATTITVSGWDHRGPIVAREEPREYAAWYQMPQGAAAYPPATAYERAIAASAAASQYAGYPRPYSRSPDYYPETAVTNNMVPSARKAAAAGYYIPAGQNTQDTYQITAIDRYFPLLGRKRLNKSKIINNNHKFGSRKQQTLQPRIASTSPTPPNAASVMKTLKPRRPLIETWKCVRRPCPKMVTLKPLPLMGRTKGVRQNKKKEVVTPRPESSRTFATVEGIKLASVKPYTFRPRHKQSNKKIVKVTTTKTTATPKTTVKLLPTKTTFEAEKTTTVKVTTPSTTQEPTKPSTTVTQTSETPSTSTSTKVPSTTSSTLSSTTTSTTTQKPKPSEVTKMREIKTEITKKTFKPLTLIKVTPFTTQEPETESTEAPSTLSPTVPSTPPSTTSTTTPSSSSMTTSKPIDFPYNLLWGKTSNSGDSSSSKPQNSAANSTALTIVKPTIPLQVVTSRIYQLLERELTNSAMEYEEMRQQIRENFKTKPWITEEEFITRIEKVLPERRSKKLPLRKEITVPETPEASYEDEEIEEEEVTTVAAPESRKKKRPNAELISAIKDVVRKFKASLDRTGVQDDVRQMSTQLESTWNDLRRGINRSWTAFRQSAETALLSPSLTSSSSASAAAATLQQPPLLLPSLPGYLQPPPGASLLTGEPFPPYIITSSQQQLKHSFMKDSNNAYSNNANNANNNTNMYLQNDISNNPNSNNNNNQKMLVNGSYGSAGKSSTFKTRKTSPFTELLLQNLYDSNSIDKNSGKLESWIERAHQMLADSVSEDDVKALLESQKNANQKIAKNPAVSIIPKEKPNKSTVIKAEKINPKFNNEFNQN